MTSLRKIPRSEKPKAASGFPGRPFVRYRAEKVRVREGSFDPKSSSLPIDARASSISPRSSLRGRATYADMRRARS
jgi:hypothetical protein